MYSYDSVGAGIVLEECEFLVFIGGRREGRAKINKRNKKMHSE